MNSEISKLLKYKTQLKKYLLSIVDESEIDDIIQNSLLKLLLLEQKNKLHNTNLKSLFFTISKNDALKLLTISKTESLSESIKDQLVNDHITINYENFFIELETSKDFNIILVRDQFNGLSIKELCNKYNLSESSIKSRLFNTKNKLKTKYEHERL